MNRTPHVAVVGATGAVGVEMIKTLEKRNFPVGKLTLLASARSVGKRLKFRGKEIEVTELKKDSFNGIDIALFSAGGSISREYAPIAAKAGCIVVDNSSAFRMDDSTPLVIPEINPADVKKHKGVIANPNCTTAITLMALYPLHQAFGVKRIFASSYQAVSGTGAKAIDELKRQVEELVSSKPITKEVYPHQIAFNVLPHVDSFLPSGYTKEEMKMENEGRKIMHHPTFRASVTCVRVPVYRAHSVAVSAEFDKPVTVEAAREVLKEAPGLDLVDEPAKNEYPLPLYVAERYNCQLDRLTVHLNRVRMNETQTAKSIHGRGASGNPMNRFEEIQLERDIDWNPEEDPAPRTTFLRDSTSTIINYNDSPDVGFEASVNPYRGCEHGCIYCFARPTHEYLGFSAGLDFETRIMVKENAPELLRKELASSKWKPQVIVLSGVTDCYQPIERKLQLTRRCLEVLADFRNPVAIVTKNFLVTRDIDLLSQMAKHNGAAVNVSLTTLDPTLTPKLEPRAPLPAARLEAIRLLHSAGVPVGVLVAPIIPAVNDSEIPAIVAAAVQAGASWAGYVPLRLPYGIKDLFDTWLGQHFPERKEKVLNQLKALREGKLNDPRFGTRMTGEGVFAEQLAAWFALACRKAGLTSTRPELSAASFRRPSSTSACTQNTFPF